MECSRVIAALVHAVVDRAVASFGVPHEDQRVGNSMPDGQLSGAGDDARATGNGDRRGDQRGGGGLDFPPYPGSGYWTALPIPDDGLGELGQGLGVPVKPFFLAPARVAVIASNWCMASAWGIRLPSAIRDLTAAIARSVASKPSRSTNFSTTRGVLPASRAMRSSRRVSAWVSVIVSMSRPLLPFDAGIIAGWLFSVQYVGRRAFWHHFAGVLAQPGFMRVCGRLLCQNTRKSSAVAYFGAKTESASA